MIAVRSWSDTPAEAMAALFDAEASRWERALHWDYASTRAVLDHVRRTRRVPGLVASVDGTPSGWTMYARVGGELQIGALASTTPDVTATLITQVLDAPEAQGAARLVYFVLAHAPDLRETLAHAGLTVTSYRYLVRSLTDTDSGSASDLDARPWRDDDGPAAVDLLGQAYPAPDLTRPFVPTGARGAWDTYLRQLVGTDACGRFQPALSGVVPATPDEGLAAVAVVTSVSETTAHLAQLAVMPAHRRRGLGRRLVDDVCARAAAAGYTRITLLVSERNREAAQLYASRGFEETAAFVCATREVLAEAGADSRTAVAEP